MKKVKLLICAVLVASVSFGQAKKDSAAKKKDSVAAAPANPALYYLVLPKSEWDKIIQMISVSDYPGHENQKVIAYIVNNVQLLPPPTPVVADTTKSKPLSKK